MHKKLKVFPAGRPHCFWLADGEVFQKPAELLAGKEPHFRSVTRSLEFSVVQAFCAEYESCLVKVQSFQCVPFPAAEQVQGIRIGVHPVCVPDNGHKAVKAAPHIGASSDDVKPLCHWTMRLTIQPPQRQERIPYGIF